MALSATVLALGLGDINTRSALNQNLNAEVELLSVDPAELDGLRVRLASPEAFQRAGVERPFFLSGLKFTPMLREDGKAVIRVHSDQPIREPFLNFLLELNWPQGRLVREYTVLLDPPATLQRRPAAVARAQSAARPAAPAAPASAAPVTAATLPDQYGPVQNGDTLWGIAGRLRMDGASLTQTLMALYKANKGAFVSGDINRLKQGSILRVPGSDEVFALSRREADAAFRAEQDLSLAARAKPSAEPAADADGEAAEAGGAAAPTAETAADAELRIATPRPEGEGEAGAGDDTAAPETADDLKNALLLAREDAETSRQAADNLRGQLDSVEQQLADMQRLLSLKDEQLARLQATVAEEGAVAPEDAVAEITREEGAQPTEETVEPAAAEVVPAEEAATGEAPPAEPTAEEAVAEEVVPAEPVAEEAAAEEAAPAEPIAEEAAIEEAAPAEPVAEEAAAEAVAPEQPAEPAVVEPEPAAKKEKGLLDMVGGSAGLAGIAVAVLVALLALLALVRRRSQAGKAEDDAGDQTLEESILMEPGKADDFDSVLQDTEVSAGETTMLSEFSPSEMDSLGEDTSDVDPVSEADVYIAYGRYDQAEELLNQALAKDPQRLALKFKLLEVFYANRKIPAFTACAQELADAGQDGVDTEAWQRVCDMGRELAPDYPLFAGGVAGGPAADDGLEDSIPDFEPSQPASIDPLSDFRDESILDIPGAEEPQRSKSAGIDSVSESLGEPETDLTLDLDDLSMPSSVQQDSDTIEGLDSIDLELPNFDTEKPRKTAGGRDDSLLLDLDTELEDSIVGSELRDDEELTADSLQQQLDELSDLTELDEELSELTADFGGTDTSSMPTAEEVVHGEEAEIPSSLMPDAEDDVQTKLDLAIAYVEMGDKEGARSILEEVQAEGNDTQKAEAQRLLGEMNA
jgi:pilus assembly protein FimV